MRGRMPIRLWWRQRQRLCARPTKRHAHERVQGMKWWWATEAESSMALNQKITHQAISGIVSTGAGHHMTAIGMSTLREAVQASDLERVRTLLQDHLGALGNLTQPEDRGPTALHWAAAHGDSGECSLHGTCTPGLSRGVFLLRRLPPRRPCSPRARLTCMCARTSRPIFERIRRSN